nr:hypothetical protein [Pandoravirus massiliensis]
MAKPFFFFFLYETKNGQGGKKVGAKKKSRDPFLVEPSGARLALFAGTSEPVRGLSRQESKPDDTKGALLFRPPCLPSCPLQIAPGNNGRTHKRRAGAKNLRILVGYEKAQISAWGRLAWPLFCCHQQKKMARPSASFFPH